MKVACPCGRCTIAGDESVIRRQVKQVSIQCGGCGRVLVGFDGLLLHRAFAWLPMKGDRNKVN